ncbi:hypothetical protein BDV12DRAFT_191949 [Aspergillus spectabilis]
MSRTRANFSDLQAPVESRQLPKYLFSDFNLSIQLLSRLVVYGIIHLQAARSPALPKMGNNDDDALTAGDSLPDLELDGTGYDANVELMLLQIRGTSNEAVPPNLRAVLDDQVDFAWPAAQRPQSPLLMERPRSSGIDTAAFSFARPAQNRKPFSLQPTSRRPSPSTLPAESGDNEHVVAKSRNNGQKDKAKSTAVPHTQSAEPATSPPNVKTFSSSTEQRKDQGEEKTIATTSNQEAWPESQNTVQVEQAIQPEPEPESNPQLLAPDVSMQDSLALSRIRCDQLPDQLETCEPVMDKALSFKYPDLGQNAVPESHTIDNQWKVVKRRHSDKRRAAKRGSHAPSNRTSFQVPEEVLFQQLISRLRAREESEAVASNLQKEMEANLSTLKEENQALKEDLEILGSKLRQRTTEAKAYRSQTNSWKSKLAKVKAFLNDLGADYQNLRGEAIHLKATRKSLDKERKEITEDIKDVKSRLVEITQASRDRRGCLSESEGLISSLGEELKHARERARYSQDQLADEKKRSHLLELSIQNSSHSQDRKLDLIKTNQLEIVKRIESAFEATSKKWEFSNTVSTDALERKMNDLLTSLRSTTDSLSVDKIDVQQCREIICTFESRMDAATRQLGEDIGSHNELAEKLMTGLEEQVQGIKDSVSDGSALLKQLSTSEDQGNQLQALLEEAVPAFEKLDSIIKGLRDTEVNLGEKMQSLEARLSEAKLPERMEDNYFHTSDKLRLENEIKHLTIMLKSTEEKLGAQQLESMQKQNELREMAARVHQAELDAAKFESHIANLQEPLDVTKSEVHESIYRVAASSRQQCGAEFEQRLHELSMEKLEIEAGMQRAREQLAEAQCRLTEADNTARSQRSDLEALLAERQKRIQDLEASEAEHAINMKKQEADIQRLREQEVVLTAQQTSLQSQLNEAHQKSDSFTEELLEAMTENRSSLGALHASFSALQGNLAKKEENCQALHDSLSFIQDKLAKKEAECRSLQDCLTVVQVELARKEVQCHALQSEVSSLEHETSQNEDACRALQDSLSSLQSDFKEKEENCQALQGSLVTLQQEVAQNKETHQALQDSHSSLQGKFARKEGHCQALQQSLSSIQSDLAKKEEEFQALNKQLEDANGARQNLESGKAKAQAQILPLLKRVQDSESGMKQAREVLHRMGITHLEQPWSDTLDQLETTLQAVNEDRSAIDRQLQVQEKLPETSASDEIHKINHGADICKGEQPATGTVEPKTPADHSLKPLLSEQAGIIVPFSTFHQEMSPIPGSAAENEVIDPSCVLTQTPDRILSTQELNDPARPEKDDPFMDIDTACGIKTLETPSLQHAAAQQITSLCMQEQTDPSAPTEQGHFQPKAPVPGRKVSFVTWKSTAELDTFQVPDSQEKDESNFLESLNGDNPARTNRWTYSKRQRETVTKQQNTSSSERVSSQTEEQTRSKKVKISMSSSVVAQTRTASELYERRNSPTRLVSRSSRVPSNGPVPGQKVTRGPRRSGRQKRGDKYNARFS